MIIILQGQISLPAKLESSLYQLSRQLSLNCYGLKAGDWPAWQAAVHTFNRQAHLLVELMHTS
jgi:hypothetical protein